MRHRAEMKPVPWRRDRGAAMGRLFFGVAGWDYEDWRGIVYPARFTSGFDRLAFLANFVDVVEIDSTFYRPAAPSAAASWIRRTSHRPGFRFCAKAHREVTHDLKVPPEDAVGATLGGLAPLLDAGALAALLVQFPQSFHRLPASLERLERIVAASEGWPLVVEVRHVSWDRPDAEAWFRSRGIGWCVVDQPPVGGSLIGPRPRATSRVGYLRLHGRNRADWFREGAGRDARYDYLYPERELGELLETARAIGSAAEEVYVVANNHFRGQALANAIQLRHLSGVKEPAAPEDLLVAYPALRGIAKTRRERLF